MSKKLLLKEIARGQPVPNQAVIYYPTGTEYRQFLLALALSHIRQGRIICYLCYSIDPAYILEQVPQELKTNITFLDFHTDPLGWNGNIDQKLSIEDSWDTIVSEERTVVIIDNLLFAANLLQPVNIARNLHKLKKSEYVCQVVITCPLEVDSLMAAVVDKCPCIVELGQESDAKIRLRLKPSKILRSHEKFRLNNFDFAQIQLYNSIEKKEINVEEVCHQTTFNLQLTDKQREAKDGMVLPHQRVQKQSAQIHYVPDDNDDWDDEDPDEDLEI